VNGGIAAGSVALVEHRQAVGDAFTQAGIQRLRALKQLVDIGGIGSAGAQQSRERFTMCDEADSA
jgi:hypothetical protein